MGANCRCDDSMMDIFLQGVVYTNIQPLSYIASFQPRSSICSTDRVLWYFTDSNVVEQTSGNEVVNHTFPGPGSYNVCMYVFRTETSGASCDVESCVNVEYIDTGNTLAVYPNPNSGEFSIKINQLWKSPVQLRVLRRDRVKVPAGTFNSTVVQPLIKTGGGGIFSERDRAEVWIADDSTRKVVQLKIGLSFGSLTLKLKSYQPASGVPLPRR